MWKKIAHRLTWMEVSDGGGGYPSSWRKGPGDYARDLFTLVVLGVALTVGWLAVLMVGWAAHVPLPKNRA